MRFVAAGALSRPATAAPVGTRRSRARRPVWRRRRCGRRATVHGRTVARGPRPGARGRRTTLRKPLIGSDLAPACSGASAGPGLAPSAGDRHPATRAPALVPLALLAPLAAALLATTAPAAATPATTDPRDGWRTVVALDEVTVDLDAGSAVRGTGAVTVQLRWTFADRTVSPPAWDYGVRYSLDVVDVDCRTGATRTRSSVAFTGDGTPLLPMSFEDDGADWKHHRAQSLGGLVARGVCDAVRGR